MILKTFELSKIDLNNQKFYLFYGDNEGLKEETVKKLFEKKYQDKIHRYEEKEILDNINDFFNSLLTKSFFDNEKLIIINRTTDKIREVMEGLIEKDPKDINLEVLETSIREKIGLNVLIKNKKNNSGLLLLEYKDLDQLNKIVEIIKSNY